MARFALTNARGEVTCAHNRFDLIALSDQSPSSWQRHKICDTSMIVDRSDFLFWKQCDYLPRALGLQAFNPEEQMYVPQTFHSPSSEEVGCISNGLFLVFAMGHNDLVDYRIDVPKENQ
jgi:hypothetical protein